MEENNIYLATQHHISKLKIDNPSGEVVLVQFNKKFRETNLTISKSFWIFKKERKSKRRNKEKYPEFNNDQEIAQLDNSRKSTYVNLSDLCIQEGDDFSVIIQVSGTPTTYHAFNCHYSEYSDVELIINTNINANTGKMNFSYINVGTDHAEDHIRYFKAKINGIHLAKINIMYKLPGESEWSKKKSGKHRKGKTVSWDCGEGELNLPDNTEVKVQLDIVGGSTKTAGESFYVRKASRKTAIYESTGSALTADFALKSYTE